MADKFTGGGIRIHGLREMNRAFKKLEGALPRELREVNKKVAEKVATKARARAFAEGSTAAHVAPSIKATAGAQSASVSGGGASSPAFAGAEFGGQGRPTTQQFQPHRGTQGYFLYPTVRAEAPDLEGEYLDALNDLIRKAGLG